MKSRGSRGACVYIVKIGCGQHLFWATAQQMCKNEYEKKKKKTKIKSGKWRKSVTVTATWHELNLLPIVVVVTVGVAAVAVVAKGLLLNLWAVHGSSYFW